MSFSIEQLQAVDELVTHKDCADGISSAMIIRNVLPGIKVTFLQYGTPELKAFQAAPGQLWCDFAPDRDRKQEFIDAGALVLDHHKFARDTVEAFGANAVFADEATEPGVCGAVLAYRHVWLPLQRSPSVDQDIQTQLDTDTIVRDLAALAGIRDTWQKKDSRWVEACEQAEALKFWPVENVVGAPCLSWPGLTQPIGHVLFAKNLAYAKLLSDTAYRFITPKGTKVLIFSGASMSSDAAEAAGDAVDIVVGFGYKCDTGGLPIVIFSTRSHANYDVGKFCHTQGGGGHTKAAGFSLSLDMLGAPNPYEHFRRILEAYEETT